MEKNEKLLPVPMKYCRPWIMEIYVPNVKKPSQYCTYKYIPEIGKWYNSTDFCSYFKKNKKRSYDDWENHWKLGDLILYSEDWSIAATELRYSNKPKYTKEYISKRLFEDHNYKCDFYILGKDLPDLYEKSRENCKVKVTYDYSLVPFKIKKCVDKITLLYEGDPYVTTCNSLLSAKKDTQKLFKQKSRLKRAFTTEEFIKKAIGIHGDKYDYSKVKYINNSTHVKIYCKKHNIWFYQTPQKHIDGIGCPKCANEIRYFHKQRFKSLEEFKECAELIHGNKYDYSRVTSFLVESRVEIICKQCGKPFYKKIKNHIGGYDYKSPGCPDCEKKCISRGQIFVGNWLIDNHIDYIPQYLLNEIKKHDDNPKSCVFIDFQIKNYMGSEIWIEYNGLQHYKYVKLFHNNSIDEFRFQLERDLKIRDYCISHNIILIEVPYLYDTQEKVNDFLDKTLIQGIPPTDLVDYDALYNKNLNK